MLDWFFRLFIQKLLEFVVSFYKKEADAKKRNETQKKKDEENANDLSDAVQKNASKEEIAKKAEDLLNGN